jgi:hypothetical protein
LPHAERYPGGMSSVQQGGDIPTQEASGAATRLVDIRGQRVPPLVTPVLADPSGMRARRLAGAGRAVAFLCLLWLVGLGLAGIGILPAGDLPLGPAITGSAHGVHGVVPAATARRSEAAPNRGATSGAADHAPLPASGPGSARGRASFLGGIGHSQPDLSAIGPGSSSGRSTTPRSAGGRSETASGAHGTANPGATVPPANAATSGGGQTAAGGAGNPSTHATGRPTTRAPGAVVRSAAPGYTSPSTRGSSGSAPGRVAPIAATVTTAPGKSGFSPGHTVTPGGGHGNGT